MTPDDFRAARPKYANETDSAINAAIALSAPYFNRRWQASAFYPEGLSCAIAHFICIGKSDAAITEANDVVTKSTEHQSTTRSNDAVKAQSADHFQRTVDGQRFRTLNKIVNMGALAT